MKEMDEVAEQRRVQKTTMTTSMETEAEVLSRIADVTTQTDGLN